ncbi:hypothetical protein [Xanthomonas graminis]|uniref:hypothetical protein n=1 Tax=Xanthomonas graminis TaxID=3390026 RepID=UPI001112DEA2|nr:hypothetical protein [Xanthomonas translucens]
MAEADHLQGSESAHASSSRAPAQRLGAQDAPVATANQAQGLVGNLPARGDNLQRRQRGVAPMDNTTLQLSDRSDSASLQTSGAQIQDARAQVPLPPGIECIAPEAEPAPSRQQATAGPSRTVNPPQGTTSKLSTLLATQLRDLALERKQEIDAAMREVVPNTDGGLELHISEQGKKRDSIRDKIERKVGEPKTPEQRLQAAASVLDVLRYDVEIQRGPFAAQCAAVLEGLEQKAMTLLRVKNAFATRISPDNPYKGVHAVFMDGIGQTFEVQFHTPQSMAAKKAGHIPYKMAQLLQAKPLLTEKQQERLVNSIGLVHETWRDVPTPDDALKVAARPPCEKVLELQRALLRKRLQILQ